MDTENNKTPWKTKALVAALVLALLAFEVTREGYVLEAYKPDRIFGPSFSIYGDGETAFAQGVWKRTDGGSPIVQGSVVIRCIRKWGSCIEVNNAVMPGNHLLSLVDIQTITEFTPEAVAFENASECAIYRVRLDIAQKRVFATRDKPPGANAATCELVEDRVATEMGGFDLAQATDASWTTQYFLPLYRLLIAFVGGEA